MEKGRTGSEYKAAPKVLHQGVWGTPSAQAQRADLLSLKRAEMRLSSLQANEKHCLKPNEEE